VVTEILPLAVWGTMARITESETTENPVAATLWKATLVAPVKLRPLKATAVPAG